MFAELLNTELEKLRRDIITRHEIGQVASGKTRESFSVENITKYTGELWGANYVGVLERGRRGGNVPKGFTDIIKRWAIAKGLSFANTTEFNRFAYFVSKKIQSEGTKLYRSGRHEDIFETAIADFTERVTEQVSLSFEKEITNKIFTQ